MLTVPDYFARTIVEVNGAAGRVWLDRLPTILAACAEQWELTLGAPFAGLSYNYAAPAIRADDTSVVVKACPPSGEFRAQSEALRVYDGRGATRLLAVDRAREVMLLERLMPGTMLSAVEDDVEATTIAAGVMRALWRSAPPEHPFSSAADWSEGFVRLRRRYAGGTGPLPPALVEEAEHLFAELSASAATPVVLHGDLHHYNILNAGARGWLSIDPKGLVGEPAYEIGAYLRNRLPEPLPNREAATITARRVNQFAGELGLDRARVRGWGLAQAVLSAWWTVEDHGHGWESMIALAELLSAVKE